MVMNELIKFSMKRAKHYTVADYGVLKICLITLGILIGAYFSDFFKKHINKLWTVFAASYGAIMYRTFGPRK